MNRNAVYVENTTFNHCYVLYETEADAELRSRRDQVFAAIRKIDFRAALNVMGYGNRCPKHLWAKKETDQIMHMKELWASFHEDKKPQWLSWKDILRYEKAMCPQPMLDELYALTLREQDGEILSDDEKDRYLILYRWLHRLGVEIPFGVEIRKGGKNG